MNNTFLMIINVLASLFILYIVFRSQRQYVIIVDKKEEKAICELLEINNLVAPKNN